MHPAALLAHASGFSWDEALLVMAPLALIGGLLWLANRRAGRLRDEAPGDARTEPAEARTEPDGGTEVPDGRSGDAPPSR